MTWSLPEPMLTAAVNSPALPAGFAAEPKWDGFRAHLAVYAGGRVLLCSRRGTACPLRRVTPRKRPPLTGGFSVPVAGRRNRVSGAGAEARTW